MTDINWKKICKKTWRFLRWPLEHIGIPIIVLIVAVHIINPPSLPDIDSTVVYNTGSLTKKLDTPFKLDFRADDSPWITIIAINKGKKNDEDLDIEFRLLRNNKIINVKRIYSPTGLKRRVQFSEVKEQIFYEKLRYLPVKGGIEYKFDLADFIKSCDDFEYSLLSKYKNWSKKTKIEPRDLSSRASFISVAYAQDEKSEKINKEKKLAKPEPISSGILIGGYDPLVMSNELFMLLQRKKLISKEQAMHIKKNIVSYKKGVLFGGVNILKLNELILNSLISSKAITIEQAKMILAKSKNSGGVLIGGYNVIVLQVEILNLLLKNKKIEIKEGQKVIVQAKSRKSTEIIR